MMGHVCSSCRGAKSLHNDKINQYSRAAAAPQITAVTAMTVPADRAATVRSPHRLWRQRPERDLNVGSGLRVDHMPRHFKFSLFVEDTPYHVALREALKPIREPVNLGRGH